MKTRRYFVESYSGWFVVETNTARKARSKGVEEFGRGGARSVRLATDAEVQDYVRQMGTPAMRDA